MIRVDGAPPIGRGDAGVADRSPDVAGAVAAVGQDQFQRARAFPWAVAIMAGAF